MLIVVEDLWGVICVCHAPVANFDVLLYCYCIYREVSVGERGMGNKKFPTHTQDLSMVMSIYERESGSTYPCRSLSGKR